MSSRVTQILTGCRVVQVGASVEEAVVREGSARVHREGGDAGETEAAAPVALSMVRRLICRVHVQETGGRRGDNRNRVDVVQVIA